MLRLAAAVVFLSGCAAGVPSRPLTSTVEYLDARPPQDALRAVEDWAGGIDGLRTTADQAGLVVMDARSGADETTRVDAVRRGDGHTAVRVVSTYAPAARAPLPVELVTDLSLRGETILPLPADGSAPVCYSVESWERDRARPPRDAARPVDADEREPVLIGGLQGLSGRVEYPPAMRRAGVQGVVLVRFVVENDGTVGCTEVLASPHPELALAAVAAVRASTFEPGRQRGEPVRVRYSVPVTFRLR